MHNWYLRTQVKYMNILNRIHWQNIQSVEFCNKTFDPNAIIDDKMAEGATNKQEHEFRVLDKNIQILKTITLENTSLDTTFYKTYAEGKSRMENGFGNDSIRLFNSSTPDKHLILRQESIFAVKLGIDAQKEVLSLCHDYHNINIHEEHHEFV